jgi:hypothetical protein
MEKIKRVRVSCYMNEKLVKQIDSLVNSGLYRSRSNLIENCIEKQLPILLKEMSDVSEFIENNDIPKVFEFVKSKGFIIVKKHPSIVRIPLGNIHFNSDNQGCNKTIYN